MDEAFNARLHKISREKSGLYYTRLLRFTRATSANGWIERGRSSSALRRSAEAPRAETADTRRLNHKRTQNRIQEIVPILRFLLLFRGIFALSRHKKHIFDRRSPSSESFCAFGGWAFLLALNLWVIVKIVVIVKIIVCRG